MSPERTLERISASSLSRKAFLRRYFYRNVPVILTDAIGEWGARDWTPERLKALLGDRQVEVRVSESGLLFDNQTGESSVETMRFADFVDAIVSGRTRRTMYFAQQNLRRLIPDHGAHVPRFRFLRKLDYVQDINLWVGNPGSVTPLHFDVTHNYFAQIYGRKEFTIFAPSDRPYLYSNTDVPLFYFVSKVPLPDPDPALFPEFRHATPYRFVLGPSDVLFLPCGWWHHVKTLDVSISINQWWTRAFSRNTSQLKLGLEGLRTFLKTKLPPFLGGRPASGRPSYGSSS